MTMPITPSRNPHQNPDRSRPLPRPRPIPTMPHEGVHEYENYCQYRFHDSPNSS
jgi:hypothetical protein